MYDRIVRQAALFGAVLALGVAAGVGLVLGDDRVPLLSVQPGAADGISVELLDGTKITGKANLEQLGVDTAFGVLKVPIAELVGFTPGMDSRPDLAAGRHADRGAGRRESAAAGSGPEGSNSTGAHAQADRGRARQR